MSNPITGSFKINLTHLGQWLYITVTGSIHHPEGSWIAYRYDENILPNKDGKYSFTLPPLRIGSLNVESRGIPMIFSGLDQALGGEDKIKEALQAMIQELQLKYTGQLSLF